MPVRKLHDVWPCRIGFPAGGLSDNHPVRRHAEVRIGELHPIQEDYAIGMRQFGRRVDCKREQGEPCEPDEA